MTGFKVPGMRKKMVGGKIIMETERMVMYLVTITRITQAMSEKNNWNSQAEYSILKQMQMNLNKMISKFRK